MGCDAHNMLKKIRKEKGITARALERKSGVSGAAILLWEKRGLGHAMVGNVLAVARALDVTFDELIEGDPTCGEGWMVYGCQPCLGYKGKDDDDRA